MIQWGELMCCSDFCLMLAADEENFLITYSPCFVIPLVLAVIITINVWIRRRRTRAWRAHADRNGFRFQHEDLETRNELIRLPVFSRGRERKLKNVLKTEVNGASLVLGDYSFKTERVGHSQQGQAALSQTICVAVDSELNVPHFFLRRQVKLFDALSGCQDIEIADDPEFSKSWLLQSDDREAAINFFGSRLRQYFVDNQHQRWLIEAQGQMVVVHNGKRIRPARSQELINIACDLIRILKLAQEHSQ
jgi:hypothetical protein